MKRKTITSLLDFAELCVQEKWPTHRVFELALELARLRDRARLREMKNRVAVGNEND